MTTQTTKVTQHVYARVAGLSYVITIILAVFTANYVASSLIVPGNDAATVHNISVNEWLFRLGVSGEILMYVFVIILSLALYVTLKPVNQNLALLALLCRLAEAIIGGVTTILSGLIPLLLLTRSSTLTAEKLLALSGLFLDIRGAGLDVVLIFIGVGGTIFCYLFFKSGYVPKILAAWGILTYLSMLILSFLSILTPAVSDSVKMIFYAPGGLFELIFGLWLMFKGIKLPEEVHAG